MNAEPHPKQRERLTELRSFGILDTPREQRFDSIVELAAELCDAPIAVINLIDEHRQWFKAEIGLGVRETPLESSICSHIILQPGLTVIPDTLEDTRLHDNPLCLGSPHLRFYAGAVLETDGGLPLGTLCVLDHRPRDLSKRQRRVLTVLAQQVMAQLQLKRQLRRAEEISEEVDHRVKNSLALVQAFLTYQSRQLDDPAMKAILSLAGDRVASIAQIHDLLHQSGSLTQIDLREFVGRLTTLLGRQAPHLTLSADVPSMIVKASDGANIGLVLNELITNALRHGFPHEGGGYVKLMGALSDRRLFLTVEDNGKGLPDDFDPEKSKGLGMRLTRSLAKQFGGTLTWVRHPKGCAFTFDIPQRA
jgi:two-component sensor histidine kinase